MNGKNALVPQNDIEMSEEQVEEARISLLQGTPNSSMVSLLRKNVEERKKQLSVLIDENKVQSSQRIANALCSLDAVLLNEEVIEAVKDGIINSKDPAKSYNEFAKASTELYNRMMKQQLSSANPDAPQNANSRKSIKVAVFDSSGATMVSIGGDD